MPSPRPVILEAIVKFSGDSDLGREVTRMLHGDPADFSGLAEPLAELERSLEIPLEPVGITSGRELILRVREDALLEVIKGTCLKNPTVTHAELKKMQADNPLLATHRLVIGFSESSRESRLVHEAYRGNRDPAEVQALATDLAALSGFDVLGTAEADDRLSMTLDRLSVLTSLVERLKGMQLVDYAQANSLMQTMQ